MLQIAIKDHPLSLWERLVARKNNTLSIVFSSTRVRVFTALVSREEPSPLPSPKGRVGIAGFTLFEMLVTLAVIGVILTVAYSPDLELSNAKKSFDNTVQSMQIELSSLHNEAMSRNTSTRIVITENSGVYTITTYYSAAPTTTCTAAIGTQIMSKTIEVNSKYQITGAAAMAGVCFYRDGSSSGGTYTISPIVADSNLKTATIEVMIATGYVDADVQ